MSHAEDAHTAQVAIKGRSAVITGGTTGIGRAIAVLLASYGASVFVCDRDADHLEDAVSRIREVGAGDGIALDLAERESVGRFFGAAPQHFGGAPDIVVMNAAVPVGNISETSTDDIAYAISVDFTAYVQSAKAAASCMIDGGDIVLIGSMSAHVLGPGSTICAGMKGGIAGFSEALRRELGPKGIKVSLIEPGKTGADFQYPDSSAPM